MKSYLAFWSWSFYQKLGYTSGCKWIPSTSAFKWYLLRRLGPSEGLCLVCWEIWDHPVPPVLQFHPVTHCPDAQEEWGGKKGEAPLEAHRQVLLVGSPVPSHTLCESWSRRAFSPDELWGWHQREFLPPAPQCQVRPLVKGRHRTARWQRLIVT